MKENHTDYYKSTVEEITRGFEQRRKDLRTGYIICGLGYIASLLLATVNIIAASVLFIIISIVFQLTVKVKERTFQKDFAKENILIGLQSDLPDCKYSYNSSITMEDFGKFNIAPTFKGFISVHSLTALYKDSQILLCDITSPYNSQIAGKKRVSILSGCTAMVTLPKSSGLDMRIVHKNFFHYDDRQEFFCQQGGLVVIDSEDSNFQQNFVVYGREGQSVPKGLINIVNSLAEDTKKFIGVSIVEDKIIVFISNKYLGRIQPILKIPVEEYMLRTHSMPEIKYVKKLIDFCSQQD